MKNEPKIRIKGFEGEWKKCLLGDISEINPHSELPDDFEYVDLESVVGTTMVSHRTENIKTAPSRAQRLAQYNDIFFQTVRPYQRNNYLFKKKDGVYVFSTGYAQIRTSMDSGFLFTILQSDSFVNQVILNSTGSSYPAINPTNLAKLSIDIIENKSEQRAIATYFRHLDSLIETADKKLASLKQVKEASLQSMFPKEGQKVPEVRFKGFEGEWKATLLKEISQKVVEKNVKLQYKITLTNSAEYGIIDQLDFFDHKISNNDNIRNYYIVRDRDFVYNPRISTSAPVGPINQNLLGYVGVVSPLYYVFRIHNIDECYLRYFFKTKLWHTFMKDNGNSGARFDRLSITDDIFEKMPIIHPADTAEQRKIASFFVHIDKQIAIAQQRLDLLRRIKSACLDEMFV